MKRVCLAVLLALVCLGTVASAHAATFETNTQCLACHDISSPAGAVSRVDFSVPGAVDYTKCAVCHQRNLPEDSHYHYGWGQCLGCHNGDMEFLITGEDVNWGPFVPRAPYYPGGKFTSTFGTFASSQSAGASPPMLHSLHSGSNWIESRLSTEFPWCSRCHAPAACSACHASPVQHGDHAVGRYPAVPVKQADGLMAPVTASTCVNPSCHALASAGTSSFDAPSCAACHVDKTEVHGYDTADHVADDALVSGVACSACHLLDLDSGHGGSACGTCHPAPRDSLGAWDQGCVTGDCHAPASSAPMHAGADAGHAPAVASQVCLECHTGSDLAGVHSDAVSASGASSCLVCHVGGAVPASKECASCHFTMDMHPVGSHAAPQSVACGESGCHDTTDVTTNHADCRTCHANPEIPVMPSSSECVGCHAEDGPRPHYSVHGANPPLMQSGAPQYAFYTGSAPGGLYTTACAICHASNLVDAHLGSAATLPQKNRSGEPLTCASCHSSADPSVILAIAGGVTACDSCHANPMTGGPGVHGPINPTHTSAFVESPAVPCSPCHSDNIVDQHNGGEAWPDAEGRLLTYCDVCHENYAGVRGQQVQSAIEDLNDTRCTACHGSGHPDLDGHRATTAESLACGGCHADDGIAIDVRAVHAECGTCHDSPGRVADIASSSAECSSCHSTAGTDFHRGLPTAHEWEEMPGTCQSANCHQSTSLPETHEPFMDRFPDYGSSCELCHQNADPGRIPAGATASCETCHGPIHPDMDHNAASSGECISCHESGDALLLHADAAEGPCEVCHANPDRVPALPTSTECVNCHLLSPVEQEHYAPQAHTSIDSSEYGYACSTCHELDLGAEHARASSGSVGCVGCHEVAVDTLGAVWNRACDSCHSVRHAMLAQRHSSPSAECAGSGCHAVSDVAALHATASVEVDGSELTACRVCHGRGALPSSAECIGCHDGHGDLGLAHTVSASEECVACHETADVRTVHEDAPTGGCAVCHDNASRVPALPDTPDCAGCHAYSPVDTGHYPAAAHAATENGCEGCHSLDLKTEHAKESSGPVDCVMCHESSVDAFTESWDHSCAACHATKHGQMQASHVSMNTACSGAGCHVISDVSDLHKGVPGGGCSICHDSSPGATTDCAAAGCHAGTTGDHHESHDGRVVNGVGCEGCHFRYLDEEHLILGLSCGTCHSSTDSGVRSAIAAGDVNCLSCHPDSAHNDRQQAEFASGNASLHRVRADLPGMRSTFRVNTTNYAWSLPSASSFLKTGYTYDTIVTCDACHAYSGTTGPHGATMKVNVDPAYPNPFRVVNGSESFTAQLSNSSPTGMSMAKNGGTAAKIICEKCHNLRTGSGSWSNVAHKEHDDRGREGAYCNQCHVAIPHGWGRPRLLGYTTDATPYRTSSGGLQRVSIKSYTPNGWQKSDCGAGCSSSRHPYSGTSWPNVMGQVAAPTTGVVSGKVVNASGAAITGAAVTVGTVSTTSASDGTYSVANVAEGSQAVSVSAAGYTTWTGTVAVTAGSTSTLNVTMVAEAASNNLARTGTASASSTYSSSYAASKAIDGSTSSYWRSSGSGTQWLRVDLGSSKSISKVVVDWNSSYYARSYRIETSSDGYSWTSRYSTSSGTYGTKTHAFAAVNARHVRVYCTSANYSNYRINEFEVWDR